MGTGKVVDVPVNRSDKLRRFMFVVAYCAENRRVSRSSGGSLLALRLLQLGPQILKSILTCSPASRGMAKCAQSMLQSRGNLDTFS